MNLLLMFLKRSRIALLVATVCGVVSGLSTTALIVMVNLMMRGEGHRAPIVIAGFAGMCVIRLLTGIVSHGLLVRLSQNAVHDLRMNLCGRIAGAPLRQLEMVGASRLMTAFAEDLSLIATAVVNLPYLFVNGIILAGCFAYLGFLSWQMLVGIGLSVSLGAASYAFATRHANGILRKAREEQERLFHHYRNLLGGVKELKLAAAGRDEFMTNQLGYAADGVRRHNIAGITIYSAAANWGRLLFFVYVGLILLWPGADQKPAQLAACVIVVLYMMAPLEAMLNSLPAMAQANVALHKLRALESQLGFEASAAGAPAARVNPIEWRELAFQHICYHYQDVGDSHRFALGPIDLVLRPEEVTFLVGGNGSGKTTLGKLIVGLYEPDSGRVLLDGEALEQQHREETRGMFAAVFNDFCLFDRLLGVQAEKSAVASGYLRTLKLNHKVSIVGGGFSTSDLSQGQRKRLALLVALLEDRPIYLFDEWAADQDPEFKEHFYHQIVPELRERGKAVVVITHDDRYFHVADRLIELENGLARATSRSTLNAKRSALPKAMAMRSHSAVCMLAIAIVACSSCFARANAVLSKSGGSVARAPEFYSGIECLQKAAALLGRPIEVVELLNGQVAGGGDSSHELAQLAMQSHLGAVVLDQAGGEQIARSPYPMLLHVMGGQYSKTPDYYVLSTGFHDGSLRVFSPSAGELSIPPNQLESDRRSEAIVISREPLFASARVLHHAVPLATYGIMLGVLLSMAAMVSFGFVRPMSQYRTSDRRRLSESGLQLVGVFIFSIVLTFVGYLASGRGLMPEYPSEGGTPIDFLLPARAEASDVSVKPREISVDAALGLVASEALFVDARDPSEFAAGHIRGAVLCPATDIGRWRIHLAGIALQRRIIVYCAEAACGKGEYVASFLLKNGFSNVSLYREGWAKWTGPKEGR